jgi:hypothetical protein
MRVASVNLQDSWIIEYMRRESLQDNIKYSE